MGGGLDFLEGEMGDQGSLCGGADGGEICWVEGRGACGGGVDDGGGREERG